MALVEKMMEKAIIYLGKDENKKRIQMFILDPLLNHVIERLFPYIILLAALFFVLVLCILIMLGYGLWTNLKCLTYKIGNEH